MKKTFRTVVVSLGVLACVLCAFCLQACGPRGGEKYEEKIERKAENDTPGIEIKISSVNIENGNAAVGVGVGCDSDLKAELKITAEILEDAEYKDTGDVICYTGKTVRMWSRSETLDIPATDHVINVEGAGVSDGRTRRITFSVTDRRSGASAEGTLLLRDGQVFLSEAAVDLVTAELTNEEMASLIVGNTAEHPVAGEAGATSPVARLGIPAISLADGPQGVRLALQTVWYPCGAILASSWDRQSVYAVGRAIGSDCDSAGVDVILGPGMNIQRLVLGGRNFEYYSEDPYVTGIIAAAYTSGVQSRGIGVSAKHYALNNQESDRGTVSAKCNERAIREIYLRGFGYLVRKADPLTIMSSYNRVNGTYSSINRPLLSVLRDEFGFNGLIMSDWGSAGSVTDKATAGNDLTEPGGEDQYREVLDALNKGKLSVEVCRECCRNILSVAARSKAYEKMLGGKPRATKVIDTENGRAAALAAAEGGMVLLKNENNALPIRENTGIALLGMAAYNPIYGGEGSGGVNPSKTVSLETGLYDAGYTVPYRAAEWFGYSNKLRKGFEEEANSWAESCEAAVIVIGRRASEGRDQSLDSGEFGFYLNDEEKTLISETARIFHAKGKTLTVLINSGDPVETASWRDNADAILWIGYPGETCGTAAANIISGKTFPSGKLTCTWPEAYEDTPYYYDFPGTSSVSKYRDDVYVGYRFYDEFGVRPAFAFGCGLTYTKFEYSNFTAKDNGDGSFTLSCTVKNTGDRSGREIVQFYVSKPGTEGLLPLKKELCGFVKTGTLKPGQTEAVSAVVTEYELESFFDSDMSWRVVPGEYSFHAAASSDGVRLTEKINIGSEKTTKTVKEKLQPGSGVDVIAPGSIAPETENRTSIALGCDTYCNGREGSYVSKYLVDGDSTTRWSGAGTSGYKWVVIDLGEVKKVDEITILWESNNAYRYTLSVSSDVPETGGKPGTSSLPTGIGWTDYPETRMTDWDLDRITLNAEVRFIKITAPKDASWCSIYEISVYEGS
ncbi:MAG: glycoside hydrolase family 3 C-terminal domain-containing protein [Clostridia bacterium]|nr:glycoside hydrolase family 3 C-terminal domain-containing protein [Clostridia bacterium]